MSRFVSPVAVAADQAGKRGEEGSGVVADVEERASFRLPGDLMAALKAHAAETGESFSDLVRRGALMVLGICPTCGQKAPAPTENEPGKDPS